jgi:hypothetical protein
VGPGVGGFFYGGEVIELEIGGVYFIFNFLIFYLFRWWWCFFCLVECGVHPIFPAGMGFYFFLLFWGEGVLEGLPLSFFLGSFPDPGDACVYLDDKLLQGCIY